jgi:hypothetical protein
MHQRNNFEPALFRDRVPEGTQVDLQHNLAARRIVDRNAMLWLNYPRLLLPKRQRIGDFTF